MDTPTAAAATAPAEPKETTFLTDLVEHGDLLVAADLPTDTRKVLGSLIHWIDAGGKFIAPEIFNPAADQAVAEEQAESARLAQRLSQLESQLQAQMDAQAAVAAGQVPAPAPLSQSPTAEIPGVIQAPPEAAAAPPAGVDSVAQAKAALAAAEAAAGAAPTPPASE